MNDGILTAPSIEYRLLSPMLIVFAVGLIGVLIEAFAPSSIRYRAQMTLALCGTVGALVAVVAVAVAESGSPGTRAVMGAVAVDKPTLFLQGTLLLVAVPSLLMVGERSLERTHADSFAPQASAVPGSLAERQASQAGAALTEVFPLTMFALGGLLLFPASNDLLTMFVALEVFSLPLYLLCGLARRRRLLSQEAAMKYFLLGAFSSAFFLFGTAMLYGYAGTLEFGAIGDAIAIGAGNDALAVLGTALVGVGLLFKVGAIPFHSWIPDVYQGAPTPITAFMAAATKIAAFGAMVRLFYVALPGLRDDWRPALWAVAIATMLVGAVLAVTQTDIKRMLAYSSIAHAGFILTGLIALDTQGLAAILFYLFVYGFTTVSAFAIVTVVRDDDGEVTELARWAGIGRRSPVIAAAFALILLSFAGIPLTGGFIGKLAVFQAAAENGATALVIVGVLSSAIAAVFYVRVVVLMFFSDADDSPTVVTPGPATSLAIGLGVLTTVAFGVFPQPLLSMAESAAVFVR
ncbi:MAG: NADH-quinone oxidoreductase subunit NuoN [Rhodococcus sp. (in: high G+C Gram-positive bacteria)]|uniref:NADH-quinone oxidoreductase subunit NuoN n=1 Tax=Rhodococcus sp. EPR-157 TaxID=1813677 RepID=UPI0007BBC6CB|nr:NADH-quinone oxidoreductase subunit NuoN [Rhodococcus sp. EPR-157]KZF05705.1 NADH-quinone oxidoreductase subunit N [Rhodococcus sp. EPR-157]